MSRNASLSLGFSLITTIVVFGLFVALAPGVRSALAAQLARQLDGPSVTWSAADFPAGDPPLARLAVAGDVGTGEPAAYQTAGAMAASEVEREFDALVLLGDNVYPSGDPNRVPATVFEPFGEVLDGPTELLAALGNHDVANGNAPGQMAALGMPGRWYAHETAGAEIIVLDSNQPQNVEQLAWLDATLAKSQARWLIVALHHPPYSSGQHGSSAEVRAAFEPLFVEHGVDLVLAGHDHDYQRSEAIGGVVYLVSGGAAKLRPTGHAEFTAAAWSTYHFVDVATWSNRLQLRAIDQSGRVFDSLTIEKSALATSSGERGAGCQPKPGMKAGG